MRLLLVEDYEKDIEACLSTIKRYEAQKQRKIDCVVAKSKEDALAVLNSSFDGALIDIKLSDGGTGTEGNDIIAEIHKAMRIPIAILTGTPSNADSEYNYLGCFKKGEVGYEEIFDRLYDVYNTGLTKILGGRGVIEDAIQGIFWKHLLPQLERWKQYNADGEETERSILRSVLNHLLELLDNDENPSHPEEMYIIPPIYDKIKTGSIIKNIADNKLSIIISPPCDLVIREGGTFKTDKVLISEIIPFDIVKEQALNGVTNAGKRQNRMTELLKNNYTDYFHWLPDTSAFSGGFINFRWITAVEKGVLENTYAQPIAQLSAPFVKEVIARFSSFYARQGQPDLDFTKLASTYLST